MPGPEQLAPADKQAIYATGVKFCYFLIFLACSILAATGIYANVTDALNKPMATKVNRRDVRRLTLPDLGICTYHPFDVHRLRDELQLTNHNISLLHWQFAIDVFKTLTSENYQKESERPTIHQEVQRKVGPDWEAFVIEYGLKCQDVFLSCKVGQEAMSYDCCENITVFVHEKYGKCFKLPKFVQTIGRDAGHTVLMSVPIYNQKDVMKYRSAVRGLTVLVEKEFVAPYTLDASYDPSIPLQPDRLVKIFFTHTTRRRKSTPDSICWSPDVSGGRPYRKCIFANWGEQYSSICGCRLLGYDKYKDYAVCHPEQIYDCSYSSTAVMNQSWAIKWFKHLKDYCYKDCDVTTYDASYTEINLDKSVVQTVRNESGKVYVLLKAYFENLETLEYEEMWITTFDSVLSQIGGQVGLYLGVSVSSILVYFVSLLDNWRSNRLIQ